MELLEKKALKCKRSLVKKAESTGELKKSNEID